MCVGGGGWGWGLDCLKTTAFKPDVKEESV